MGPTEEPGVEVGGREAEGEAYRAGIGPVGWPGEFHGLYSSWGRKESDTTERFSLYD